MSHGGVNSTVVTEDAATFEALIRRNIAERGFYVVMDNRISLLCPAQVIRDAVLHRDALRNYAAERGWIADGNLTR